MNEEQESQRRFYELGAQDLLMPGERPVWVPALYTVHVWLPAEGDFAGDWRMIAATLEYFAALEIAGHFQEMRGGAVQIRDADGQVKA